MKWKELEIRPISRVSHDERGCWFVLKRFLCLSNRVQWGFVCKVSHRQLVYKS